MKLEVKPCYKDNRTKHKTEMVYLCDKCGKEMLEKERSGDWIIYETLCQCGGKAIIKFKLKK